jgi:hypothetical protein
MKFMASNPSIIMGGSACNHPFAGRLDQARQVREPTALQGSNPPICHENFPISVSTKALHHQFYSSVLEKITLSSSQKQNQRIPIISSVILMQQTREHDEFVQLPNHPTFWNKKRKCGAGRENYKGLGFRKQ